MEDPENSRNQDQPSANIKILHNSTMASSNSSNFNSDLVFRSDVRHDYVRSINLPLQQVNMETVRNTFEDQVREGAELIQRVFGEDPLQCPKCGSRMRPIATIIEANVVTAILDALGLPSDKPVAQPVRGPPDDR